jgi:hypothetical protein
MLGSDTGFEVQVRLAQGQGGFEDAQYELHATGDLVVFEMLLIGGTFESTPRRAHVRHGAAQFGFQVVRVDRFGLKDDRLPGKPAALVKDLGELAGIV